VRTAEIVEAKGIVYVRGRKPSPEGLALARKSSIPIFTTRMLMYKASGLLYAAGIPGVGDP